MPYATANDFTARFGPDELLQLTDRNHDGATDADVLGQAISDADAEIDAYLAGRFALPLSGTVPPVLVRIACDVIRYRLWDQAASEEVTTRYNAAVKFLQSVASGLVKIGVEPEPAATADTNAALSVSSGRVFTRDTLRDY